MQLLYVWIDNFNTIEKQGFNFSSKYTFELDFSKETPTLTCLEHDNYINNFFGEEVNEITAIVGKNGSGKSSILEIIQRLFSEMFFDLNFFIVFKKGENIFYDHNWEFKRIEFGKMCKKFKKYGLFSTMKPIDELKNRVLFYSNVLDGSRQLYGLNDISTDCFVRTKGINRFNLEEVKRQVIFLSSNINGFVKSIGKDSIPKQLAIRFKIYEGLYEIYKEEYKVLGTYFNKELKATWSKMVYEIKDNDKKILLSRECQKILFYKAFTDSFFIEFLYFEQYRSEIPKIEKKIIDLNEGEKIIPFIKNILKNDILPLIKSKRNEIKRKIFNFLNYVEGLIDKEGPIKFGSNIDRLKEIDVLVNISDNKSFQEFYTIYNEYLSIFERPINDFVSYDWRNMSTGEKAMLNLFSRFHFAKNEFSLADDIIVLIDEGESYFHPEWQKQYINDLVVNLPKLLNKKVQFIIATNSPILVSDLPKQNLIFLDKENGKTIISKLSDHRETFAANIHSLYRDAFFIKEGLFGDFAKGKIEGLIDLINNKSKLQKNKEYVIRMLSYIGDDFIRNKLHSMIKRKLETDLVNVDYRITQLEKELKALKQKKDDKDKS